MQHPKMHTASRSASARGSSTPPSASTSCVSSTMPSPSIVSESDLEPSEGTMPPPPSPTCRIGSNTVEAHSKLLLKSSSPSPPPYDSDAMSPRDLRRTAQPSSPEALQSKNWSSSPPPVPYPSPADSQSLGDGDRARARELSRDMSFLFEDLQLAPLPMLKGGSLGNLTFPSGRAHDSHETQPSSPHEELFNIIADDGVRRRDWYYAVPRDVKKRATTVASQSVLQASPFGKKAKQGKPAKGVDLEHDDAEDVVDLPGSSMHASLEPTEPYTPTMKCRVIKGTNAGVDDRRAELEAVVEEDLTVLENRTYVRNGRLEEKRAQNDTPQDNDVAEPFLSDGVYINPDLPKADLEQHQAKAPERVGPDHPKPRTPTGHRSANLDSAASSPFQAASYFANERRFSPMERSVSYRRASTPLCHCSSPTYSHGSPRPNIVTSPGGRHVQLMPEPTVQETPFTKTLNYFKQLKDKDHSPSKSRRKTSLPEELAEIAQEAGLSTLDGSAALLTNDDEDLNRYREMDLAPMEPILRTGSEESLTMLEVPMTSLIDVRCEQGDGEQHLAPGSSVRTDQTAAGVEAVTQKYHLDIPGHYGELHTAWIETHAPPQYIAEYMREQGRRLDAAESDIEAAVSKFLAGPSSFVTEPEVSQPAAASPDVDVEVDHEAGFAKPREDPVFVNVIGLLPKALLYTVAVPLAKYTDQIYEAVVQSLSGFFMGFEDDKATEDGE